MLRSKHLVHFIKFILIATFFVPLIVLPTSYIFPFIVPKIVWFRSLTLLTLGAYILLLASDWQKYRIRLTPMSIVVSLFFISFAISTFAGVDWYKSFWDNHERMLGLFTIFHFVLYYFIATSVIKEWSEWKWLLRTFLFAGSIVMIVGFFQKLNPQLLLNNGSDRVSATLGNPIYYSGYGLFLLFVGYFLAMKEKRLETWWWLSIVGGVFGFLGIFFGGTRGAVLGLIAGVFLLSIIYIFTLKEHPRVRLAFSGLLVLGIIMFGVLFTYRQTNFVQNIPAVGRLVNTTVIDPGSTRVMAWEIAIEAWREKPIFGWGPNNYFYAYNKYYRPEFLEHGWGETWFDNAHNVVMNTLAVQGSVGILAYFGLFITLIIVLWRAYRQKRIDAHFFAFGTAFACAHFVSLVTVFENPTSYLYFFFFLAFVNSQSLIFNLQSLNEKNVARKDVSVGLMVAMGLFIFLLIYSTDINPARANQATLNSIRMVYSGQDAVAAYQTAASIPSPHIDDIRNDFSRAAIEDINKLAQNKQLDKAVALFTLVHDELSKNLLIHPLDIRVSIQLAQLEMLGAQLKNDPNLFFAAEKLLDEALSRSPKRQQIQYMLSGLKMQVNKPQEAIKLLEDSITNDDKISEGWWRLAYTYYQSGDIVKAQETINNATAKGIIFDSQGQSVVSMITGGTSTKK